MVDELDCDRLNKNRQDTVLFYSIDVPKRYTSLRLVRQTYGVDIDTWEPPNRERCSS